jgi:hypothetical protein
MAEAPARRPAGDPNTPERNFAARIIVIGAVVQQLLADDLQSKSPEQIADFESKIAGNIATIIQKLDASGPVPPQWQKARDDLAAHAAQIAGDFIKVALGGETKIA